MGFLLYFLVVQASLFSRVVGGGNVSKAVDGAGYSVVWNTYRAVHLTIGLIIMIPTLFVAFFPFMTHFQVQRVSVQQHAPRRTYLPLPAADLVLCAWSTSPPPPMPRRLLPCACCSTRASEGSCRC